VTREAALNERLSVCQFRKAQSDTAIPTNNDEK